MAKTYLPSLVHIVHTLCVYIARYKEKIRSNLAGDALAAFDALEAACSAFMSAYTPPTPPD